MKPVLNFFCFLFIVILFSCGNTNENEGPFFGNGFHNGCTDNTSIVIWTRLTKNAEGNAGGEKFLIPSA
ncbi:MAG: hypothetical protein V2I31_13640, partial [Mariniphaga sp.]|nr:hypothetical protein [Mariniphaga sp.]